MAVLAIEDLGKSFGAHTVLRGLNLEVPEHSVFGFVGQNGAGKTTTMKIVLGLLRAERGRVTVCGEAVAYGRAHTNRHIGYLPDVPEFYGYMRPMEYLALCGEIAGMKKRAVRERSDALLGLVGLTDLGKRISTYSRGMKQRLGIAQALLHEPRLLICDEPTSALDPVGRKEILDIFLAIKGRTTVLFSSHILSDVERICDRIAVLHDGRAVLSGPLAEIKAGRKAGYVIEFQGREDLARFARLDALAAACGGPPGRDGLELTCALPGADGGRLLIDLLAKNGIVPVRFQRQEPTLEHLFLEVVE